MLTNTQLKEKFQNIFTPHIADACVRLNIALRLFPTGIQPTDPASKIAGRALPVKHFGSVDIFFEVMNDASKGDILVIDNELRLDEACIGDLTALEARSSGITGFVIYGLHRDTADLQRIGFPVFSYGSNPKGPTRIDERTEDALKKIELPDFLISRDDVVFADSDGVIVIAAQDLKKVLEVAKSVKETELRQTKSIADGNNMRTQLKFDEYLQKRKLDSNFTFRQHLRIIGGAIEE